MRRFAIGVALFTTLAGGLAAFFNQGGGNAPAATDRAARSQRYGGRPWPRHTPP